MVNLKKGQKISLTKADTGLKRIMVGLGWDEAPQIRRGLMALFSSRPADIDCDASVILCGENGRLIAGRDQCIYFGNLRHSTDAIIHQGDNLTGSGEGDDEQIMVDLSMIPGNVAKLVFVVNIYDANVRRQHFGMIQNAFIRIVNCRNNTEICRYNLTEDYSGYTGLIVGEIYRDGNEWQFNAVGRGVKEASRLIKLVEMYK